jgi:hypothetical protein
LRKTVSVKAAFGTAQRRQALTDTVFRKTLQSQRIDGYPSPAASNVVFLIGSKLLLIAGMLQRFTSLFKLVANFWIVR